MRSGVNLVAILLTLSCLLPTPETKSAQQERNRENPKRYTSTTISPSKKVIRAVPSKLSQQNALALRGSALYNRDKVATPAKTRAKNDTALMKSSPLARERPRRRKHMMDRIMMAMLMAYKMKFIALIPTILGGLLLLASTALAAGFFFSLFAAVLGLKTHR